VCSVVDPAVFAKGSLACNSTLAPARKNREITILVRGLLTYGNFLDPVLIELLDDTNIVPKLHLVVVTLESTRERPQLVLYDLSPSLFSTRFMKDNRTAIQFVPIQRR
jgi:hypothetical protein